jgi:hypothetical protein
MAAGYRNADTGLNFRMRRDQSLQLKTEAAQLGISVQALLELRVFGEIAPRLRLRRDAQLADPSAQLPFAGKERLSA